MDHGEIVKAKGAKLPNIFINHFPLDFNHEVLRQYKGPREKSDQISCINKIMAKVQDNGRYYDFDATSAYNKSNKSKRSDLIWIKLKQSKTLEDIMTLDQIEELLQKFNITYDLYKDSVDSCILDL